MNMKTSPVILISGASQGLGRELALQYAAQGASLFLCARNVQQLKQTASLCLQAGSPDVQTRRCDQTVNASVNAACRAALKHFGGIDILINNAAVHSFAAVCSLSDAQLEETLDTNVSGPLRFIRTLLPAMLNQGSGKIVNITSTIGLRAIPWGGAYCASKAALMRLTESLRNETRGSGVQIINAIPGVIRTRLRQNALISNDLIAQTDNLPMARSAEQTAREIIKGIEKGKRDIFSASWPIWFFMKILNPLFPGLADWMLSKNTSVEQK